MAGIQNMSKTNRVLVYLKDVSRSNDLLPAPFGKCILDFFGYGAENSGNVSVQLADNKLILQKSNIACDDTSSVLRASSSSMPVTGLLRHPSLCPSFHLTTAEYSLLSTEVKNRGVDVGVAVLLTSSDNHVMVTRRSAQLRTFPGVWVPPGGHVDAGETILAAGLRELREETGLDISSDSAHLLGLWESVYPHMLEAGQPVRQHIVAYLAIETKLTWRELSTMTKLNYEETDAALWLPIPLAEKMSTGKTSGDEDLPEQVTILFCYEDNRQDTIEISTDQLLQIKTPPPDLDPIDLERITWGTMFALQQWVSWSRSARNRKSNL